MRIYDICYAIVVSIFISPLPQLEDMARADARQNPCILKVQLLFGKTYLNRTNKKIIPNGSSVNGANNPSSISAMLKIHFESL